MSPPPARAEAPGHYVIVLAACFCATFGSYFAVANQLTSTMGRAGFFLLVCVQGAFVAGSFLGAAVLRRCGPRATFLGAALGFAAFALCLALDAPVGVLFVVGALTGCGGSWMWVAQGAYVSSLVRAERQGAVFGIFNSVFALNGVWAFFLLLVLDQSGVAPDTVAWVFAATSCCAAFSFVCVREWPPPVPQSPPPPPHHHRPPEQPKPLSAQLCAMFQMFRVQPMLLQGALACWAGNTEGMYWTTIAANYRTPTLIAACFLTQSVVALLASGVIGRASDRFGRLNGLAVCLLVSASTNIATGIGAGIDENDAELTTTRWGLLLLGAVGFGISDFPGQALMRANYIKLWEDEPDNIEAAMAHMLFILMVGTLGAALYGSFVDVWVSVGINSFLAVLALACQWALPRRVNGRQPPPAPTGSSTTPAPAPAAVTELDAVELSVAGA